MSEMVKVAGWKTKGGAQYSSADDYFSWVGTTDSASAGQFHPLMQGSANANSYVRIKADADTAQDGFGDGGGSDKSITAAMQTSRAAAQANIWFADWYLAAYNNELENYIGIEANKASLSDWSTQYEIGKAEAVVASK